MYLTRVSCRKRGDEKQIEKALHDFGNEELAILFEYVREWNTKPKFCHVAQFVFFKILNIYSPTEIIKVVVFTYCCALFKVTLKNKSTFRFKTSVTRMILSVCYLFDQIHSWVKILQL